MNAKVATGQSIQLKVRTSGLDDGEEASFAIFKMADKKQLATVQGKVVDGFATAEWTAEGPKEDEDVQEWQLGFKVKCAGMETDAAPLLVYTDWVELKCVDKEDKALEGVPWTIQVSETIRRGKTDGGGLGKAEELPHGPPKVTLGEPYEVMEWVDDKAPKLEVKVRKALPGKWIWPKAGSHEQYVNLEPGDEPELGSKITVKATLEHGKSGDLIYFKTEWAEENSKRNDPKPEVVGGVEEAWCENGGKQLSLSEDGGEVELEIELGLAGGDVVNVFVSGTEEFKAELTEVVTVVNWRKLYYQITRYSGVLAPDLGMAKSALAEVFVEYEQSGEVVVGAEEELPKTALIPGFQLEGSRPILNIGPHDVDWWHAKFDAAKSPHEAHLILADNLFTSGLDGSPTEQTLEKDTQYSKGMIQLGSDSPYTFLALSLIDGESSVRPGSTWTSLAPAGHPDHGKSGEITAKMVTFRSRSQLLVSLPQEAREIVGPDTGQTPHPDSQHQIHISLIVHLAVEQGGMCDGLHQVLPVSWFHEDFNGVVVHELGHAVQMCLEEVPPGLSAGDHGREYTDRGHHGPHCGHGVNEGDWADGQDFRTLSGGCVMWGGRYNGSSIPLSFCPRCKPFTQAQELREIKQD